MARPKRNILFNSKVLVAVIAAVMLLLGVLQLAQGLIDTHDYREKIRQAVLEKTGKELTIKGKVSVALLPAPTIYLPGVEIRDSGATVNTPIFTAEMAYLRASVFSLLRGTTEIASISLQHPTLEIERTNDGVIHWDWLQG